MSIPGPTPPAANHWPGFWDDPFLEPKQQHRFLINFPLFMPSPAFMGTPTDTMLLADDLIKNGLERWADSTSGFALSHAQAKSVNRATEAKFNAHLKKKFPPKRAEEEPAADPPAAGRVTRAGPFTTVDGAPTKSAPAYGNITANAKAALTLQDLESAIVGALRPVLGGTGLSTTACAAFVKSEAGKYKRLFNQRSKLGPNNPGTLSGTKITLRVGQYLGVSFTPPAPNYQRGTYEFKTGGTSIYNPAKDSFDMGEAKLTMVTSLQDDLHFSLNLLYSIAMLRASIGTGIPTGFQLFNDLIYAKLDPDDGESTDFVEDPNRILTIVEYAARGVSKTGPPPMTAPIPNSAKDGVLKSTIVGIHKLRDPIIKGVNYSEYSYGGADLLKVTITLGYGEIKPNRFYSYEVYDDDPLAGRQGRWDNKYHTHFGESFNRPPNKLLSRQRGQDGAPEGSLAAYYTKFPNWWSDNDVARWRLLRPFQKDMVDFRRPTEVVGTRGNPHLGRGERETHMATGAGPAFEEGLSKRNTRIREIAATYEGYAQQRQVKHSQLYSARKNGTREYSTEREEYSIPGADKLNSLTTGAGRWAVSPGSPDTAGTGHQGEGTPDLNLPTRPDSSTPDTPA